MFQYIARTCDCMVFLVTKTNVVNLRYFLLLQSICLVSVRMYRFILEINLSNILIEKGFLLFHVRTYRTIVYSQRYKRNSKILCVRKTNLRTLVNLTIVLISTATKEQTARKSIEATKSNHRQRREIQHHPQQPSTKDPIRTTPLLNHCVFINVAYFSFISLSP